VLVAQPFNTRRLAVSGDAVRVTERVGRYFSNESAVGDFSISANGVLAYAIGGAPTARLAWYDRSGRQLSDLGQPGNFSAVSLSPDGRRAAVEVLAGDNRDIWLFDTQRAGVPSRFTFDPAVDRSAIWSPDGRTLIFASNRKGAFNLYRKNADGGGAEELLYEDAEGKSPTSWSPDGELLLYQINLVSRAEMRVLPLAPSRQEAPRKPHPWLAPGSAGLAGKFSPDGKWVVYASGESGQPEVYLAPFPGPGGKRQVSPAGGTNPRWRRDGKEIFFLMLDSTVTASGVNLKGETVEIGTPHPLFKLPTLEWDVSPDGQRFLVAIPTDENGGEEIRVVQNWTAGLKR
jgi:Tol biopolymer transport system component